MKEKSALQSMTNRPLNREQIKALMNRKCPCGSGKKYKNCCLKKDLMRLVEAQAKLMTEGKKGVFDGRGRLAGTIKISKGGKG